MLADYADAIAREEVFEGGFALRSTEPGGAVNFGISMQTFVTWRALHGEPKPSIDDLRAMKIEEAEAIYNAYYASRVAFDDLPAGIDFLVLDSSINDGINWALRELSAIVGFAIVKPWPSAPPIVEAVADWLKSNSASDLIDRFTADRLAHKQHDYPPGEWEKFQLGWTRRIEAVRQRAKGLAGV